MSHNMTQLDSADPEAPRWPGVTPSLPVYTANANACTADYRAPRVKYVKDDPVVPSFIGFLETTMDSLLLIEAAMQGRIPVAFRRPSEAERPRCYQSGHVFYFEEESSKLQRWTDGVMWSASRILTHYLVYREVIQTKNGKSKKKSAAKGKSTAPVTGLKARITTDPRYIVQEADRKIIASLIDTFDFVLHGLIKKTFTLKLGGLTHHLVSYYRYDDVKNGRLRTPSNTASLAWIVPRPEFLLAEKFDKAPLEPIELQMIDERSLAQRVYGGVHPDNRQQPAHPLAQPAYPQEQPTYNNNHHQQHTPPDHVSYGLQPAYRQPNGLTRSPQEQPAYYHQQPTPPDQVNYGLQPNGLTQSPHFPFPNGPNVWSNSGAVTYTPNPAGFHQEVPMIPGHHEYYDQGPSYGLFSTNVARNPSTQGGYNYRSLDDMVPRTSLEYGHLRSPQSFDGDSFMAALSQGYTDSPILAEAEQDIEMGQDFGNFEHTWGM
ncbi:Gti1/Pac2 family-domain-containing protein [Poronia punctata]|nr:Gti1/Pac2 family-domain-containing protein [Poronia punctata]